MQYNVREIPEGEFNVMRFYVERAYAMTTRGGYIEPAEIDLVTTDMNDIPAHRRKARHLQEKFVGWAFRSDRAIWLRPGRSAFDMRRTAIHEITHLRSDGDCHGPKFRKTCGIALAQWMRHHGHSWADVEYEISNIVRRYRNYRAFTPQGKYNDYNDYWGKVQAEINTISKAARKACA